MKKSLIMTFALVWLCGIPHITCAATPFSDVPTKHWSYAAVNKLAAEGIIDGESTGEFQGEKALTRYEFAVLVSKAITKEDKVNAEQKALIDKLAREYEEELKGLGVRVKALEDKAGDIHFAGTARLRADAQTNGDTYDDQHVNLDLNFTYKVNPDWTFVVENEYQRKINDPSAGDSAGDNAIKDNDAINSETEQMYGMGPVAGAIVKGGRYGYKSAYGLVIDSKVTGAEVSFGNVVKTSISVGNTDGGTVGLIDNHKGIEADWGVTPDTNVRANFSQINIKRGNQNYYTVGFDTKIADNLVFAAAAAKSSNSGNNKAVFTELKYKEADSVVVGSSDIFVNYRKLPSNAIYYTTKDTEDRILDINFKGVRAGFDYVPMLNSKLTVWFMSGKDADTSLNQIKVYRGQLELYF